MAYADFVTAMMALFIVLWIVGQSKAVKEAIAAYFKDPGVFTSGRSGGVLPGRQKTLRPPRRPCPGTSADEMEKLKAAAGNIQEAIAVDPGFQQVQGQDRRDGDR